MELNLINQRAMLFEELASFGGLDRGVLYAEPIAEPVEAIIAARERELAAGRIDQENERLRQVKAAIRRLDRHEYGFCEECGCGISEKRLKALPWAATCIQCASKMERRAEVA